MTASECRPPENTPDGTVCVLVRATKIGGLSGMAVSGSTGEAWNIRQNR